MKNDRLMMMGHIEITFRRDVALQTLDVKKGAHPWFVRMGALGEFDVMFENDDFIIGSDDYAVYHIPKDSFEIKE